MIPLQQAQQLVRDHALPLPPVRATPLECLGLVPADDVRSPVDCPAYDKAMMDGYAVIAADIERGSRELSVIDEVHAGQLPRHVVVPGTAVRIMTGAPLPAGADSVVMVERTVRVGLDRVRIEAGAVLPGGNVMRRGTSLQCGNSVIARGSRIRPIEVGLLAEVGQIDVPVIPLPRVAVMATGNELVPYRQSPPAGKIRNSNGPMLLAAATWIGATPVDLGIASDDCKKLSDGVARGLQVADVLVLSGGVSAGVKDLVPDVLTSLGVTKVFHKVRLKPGKPVWFGVRAGDQRYQLVFGLPGNPVSSLVCFQLLVRPALLALAGRGAAQQGTATLPLAVAYRHRGDRPTYYPVRAAQWRGSPAVETLDWQGSADLATLAAATGLAHFPAGDKSYEPGIRVEVLPL
jgi:molybdopterin molybdotransferase